MFGDVERKDKLKLCVCVQYASRTVALLLIRAAKTSGLVRTLTITEQFDVHRHLSGYFATDWCII